MFGTNPQFAEGMIAMVRAMCIPTFTLLGTPEAMARNADVAEVVLTWAWCGAFLLHGSAPRRLTHPRRVPVPSYSVHPRLSHADWRLQPGVVPDSGLQDFFGLYTAVLKTNPHGNFDRILHHLKRVSQLHTTPHVRFDMPSSASMFCWMPIGAFDPHGMTNPRLQARPAWR